MKKTSSHQPTVKERENIGDGVEDEIETLASVGGENKTGVSESSKSVQLLEQAGLHFLITW